MHQETTFLAQKSLSAPLKGFVKAFLLYITDSPRFYEARKTNKKYPFSKPNHTSFRVNFTLIVAKPIVFTHILNNLYPEKSIFTLYITEKPLPLQSKKEPST